MKSKNDIYESREPDKVKAELYLKPRISQFDEESKVLQEQGKQVKENRNRECF